MKRSLLIAIILIALTSLLTPAKAFGARRAESQVTTKALNVVPTERTTSNLVTLEAPELLPLKISEIGVDEQLSSRGFESFSVTDIALASVGCSQVSSAKPLEIPDDGSWIQVCYSDPHAPPTGTVTEVHVKYILDHPDPSELEIQITRSDMKTIQTLWNRGTPANGTELGKARGIQTFKGSTAQAEWRLQIRDLVPGKKGYLKTFTVRVDYAPTGPQAIQKAGSPAKPGSFYFPQGTMKSKTPDRNPNKPASPTQTPK